LRVYQQFTDNNSLNKEIKEKIIYYMSDYDSMPQGGKLGIHAMIRPAWRSKRHDDLPAMKRSDHRAEQMFREDPMQQWNEPIGP
jgi:hypothetical protein